MTLVRRAAVALPVFRPLAGFCGTSVDRRTGLRILTASLLSCLTPGCELFPARREDEAPSRDERPGDSASPTATRRTAATDAIRVEIVFVERHRKDPLIGPALWQEIEQSTVEAADRTLLLLNGWRIGHASSTPPVALQTMLGLRTRIGKDPLARKEDCLVGHRVTLRGGAASEIQASPVYPKCRVVVRDHDGERTADYENARCVLRVTADRVQDGWARLEFVPEIHHGPMQLRRVAADYGFELKNSQNVEPLYPQRFSAVLNVGEMLLVSADDADAPNVGHVFFRGAEPEASGQRVTIVRLADLRRTDALYAE